MMQQDQSTEIVVQSQSANAIQMQTETNAVLAVIERVATDPNADIAKLEKMLDLQERILNRNAEQAFSAAFAQMQKEIPVVTERGEIVIEDSATKKSYSKGKYARFEDIIEAVRPVLSKYGFGLSHRIDQSEARIRITGTLRHELGHSVSTDFMASADDSGRKNNVQAIGSTISYGKRYTTCALLCIATKSEDDDGAKSSSTITTEQAAMIDTLIRATETNKERFLKYLGAADVLSIPAGSFNMAVSALNSKKAANAKKAEASAQTATVEGA